MTAGFDIPGFGRDHEIALLSGGEAYTNSHGALPAWTDGLPTVTYPRFSDGSTTAQARETGLAQSSATAP